ncbi:sigma-70 family RNA polymerase sigma factor [Azospirillum picis]|uniref:RNA polymerase sigma-70 factor (ECF subfamily) n=1 Tax=Azospirillum picis TaxID=488438 RepID=A0ABU0MRC5_9PROT|nr:sigma-70 family RNA polymerase sigma factor [Azospirillum picis]MBP2302459.1 RNA polymerase sigma-70 factor (ECF subfamily) [Azospirillum picis]MDQ0536038.1 RNA polymerase sigma-70 factor (ECF subfamily) [Azospirillum picis]
MKDMMLLVEPLIPALRRYAKALLRDPAGADDLVQDCLERVIARWHQRRADGDARTWVFSILHNLAMTRLSRARRRWHVALEDADETATAAPPTQEHGVMHRDLMRALETLPEEQRSVLLLVSVEDLSYAEAARVLDIPIGTVMSRLARAREKLLRATEAEAPATGRGTSLRRVK